MTNETADRCRPRFPLSPLGERSYSARVGGQTTLTLSRHEALPDPITFACAVYRALDGLSSNDANKTEWTQSIANIVARLCPYGLEVYGRQWKSLGRGEYLLDQCWRQCYTDSTGILRIAGAIVFAMECEWLTGIRDQFRDFQKLLDVRSELSLYVGALSRFSTTEEAVITMAVLTSLHSAFVGDLVVYHFDRESPRDNFNAWLIRRPDVTKKPSVHSLTEFIRGQAFHLGQR